MAVLYGQVQLYLCDFAGPGKGISFFDLDTPFEDLSAGNPRYMILWNRWQRSQGAL